MIGYLRLRVDEYVLQFIALVYHGVQAHAVFDAMAWCNWLRRSTLDGMPGKTVSRVGDESVSK
jgi:hypothetical protein